MELLFFILAVLVSIILSFFVLIQNPEGGGLSSSIGGFSNQVMGVKKTNSVLENGTWLFALIIGIMCLFSVILFTGANASSGSDVLKKLNTNTPVQTEAPAAAPIQAPATTPDTKQPTK